MKNLNNLAKLNKAALAATSSLWIFDVELHVQEARAAGATEQDLAETPMVAAVMRAGAAVNHVSHFFKN